MPAYTYLIIGAGMTADAAVQGIREVDPVGTIGVVGAEAYPPYARPPLSKKLWFGKAEETIWRGTEKLGITLHAGRRVVRLDLAKQSVVDDEGMAYQYERLLLATGGRPRQLPFTDPALLYFRTLDDYRRLRTLAAGGGRLAVIGGGFIGSEIAAALASNGCEVTLVFSAPGLCHRAFPGDLSAFVTEYYRGRGVKILCGQTVTQLRREGENLLLSTTTDEKITVRGVVAGLGITPNVELAREAGLPVEDGVVVDERLQAGWPGVFAAGDLASFYNPLLATRLRVEHEDNALRMGRQAGRNMAGADEPYHYLPYFYSDLFDLGYEAIGELDGRMETVADWREPYRQGVVYYLRAGRVRGVLLWNVWDQVESARRLLAEPGPWTAADLRGQL